MDSPQKMEWKDLLSDKRLGTDKPEPEDDIRTPYQRDIDRIIFSGHFRRLGRKTQVHPLNENDHIHSRLSHSIETASVGRSLGQYIGNYLIEIGEIENNYYCVDAIGQILQAACLAHDIGNPPFGHSGENSIREWFISNQIKYSSTLSQKHLNDFLKFDGNAMAFRVATKTGFDGGNSGMRLTYAVLGALLKYPMTSDHAEKNKFSCFQSEVDDLNVIAESLGLIKISDNKFARHPLAFLMEAADDICYRMIDLEDATEVGILDDSYIFSNFKDCLDFSAEKITSLKSYNFRQRNGIIRAKIIHSAILEIVDTFKRHYNNIITGKHNKSLMESSDCVVCKKLIDIYKSASETIFFSRRKVELEIGAYRSLAILLETFTLPAYKFCLDSEQVDMRKKIESILGRDRIGRLSGGALVCFYEILLMILDYITGMTDQYATQMCRKFIGIGG